MPTVVTITVDADASACVPCQSPASPTVADVMAAISQLKELIMSDQATLAAALAGIASSLTEASTEINAKLAELQAAIAAAGNTTPEVDAALASVQTLAQGLADIVPNT